jgi:hypothetical protein
VSVPDRAQVEAGNLFMSYRRGWIDGGTGRRKSPDFMQHTNPKLTAAYEVGYDHAAIAYDAAIRTAMATYGYEPDILRGPTPPKSAGEVP